MNEETDVKDLLAKGIATGIGIAAFAFIVYEALKGAGGKGARKRFMRGRSQPLINYIPVTLQVTAMGQTKPANGTLASIKTGVPHTLELLNASNETYNIAAYKGYIEYVKKKGWIVTEVGEFDRDDYFNAISTTNSGGPIGSSDLIFIKGSNEKLAFTLKPRQKLEQIVFVITGVGSANDQMGVAVLGVYD